MYRVEYRKEAARDLLRMPRNQAQLIREKIDALAANPYAPNKNVKALTGVPAYRLRVGDWRIIYEVHSDTLIILVLRIASRGSVYK